jgi:hypothetical protein
MAEIAVTIARVVWRWWRRRLSAWVKKWDRKVIGVAWNERVSFEGNNGMGPEHCWGQAFSATWRIPIANPVSWAPNMRQTSTKPSAIRKLNCCVFCRKAKASKVPTEGSKWPARRSEHVNTMERQKSEASHRWSDESCCVDSRTWWNPLGQWKALL